MKLTFPSLAKKRSSKKNKNIIRSQSSFSSSSDDGSVLSSQSPYSSSPTTSIPSSNSSTLQSSNGKITRQQLEAVLRLLGPDPPTEDEVNAMIDEVITAADQDGCIRLEDIGALATTGVYHHGEGAIELFEVFSVFDADKDGIISAEELKDLLVSCGDNECTIEDCRKMIGSVDANGDGQVCFDDFVRMMGRDCPVS